jgi:hypothetical protein
MLSNKILPDESRAGNENRAHVGKAGRYQMMTPRSADGSVAGGAQIDPANSVKGNEMPPGILRGDSVPMTTDSHAGGRHTGLQNLAVKPGEVSRSARAEETRRRIYSRGPGYRY